MLLFQIIKRIFLLIGALAIMVQVHAQTMELTLDEAIALGKQKSFEAFRAKNNFLSSALDYQTSIKLLYPKATFSLTPSNYSRSIEEQWDSNNQQNKPVIFP